jgi:hypothetical protein
MMRCPSKLPALFPLFAVLLGACTEPGRDADASVAGRDATVFPDAAAADAGVEEDAGADVDAGTDAGVATCRFASDCTLPADLCLDDETGVMCGRISGCSCYESCDFNAPAACTPGRRCAFLGATSEVPGQGICVPALNGGAHGVPCRATFDASGNVATQSCEIGNYCAGASAEAPTGVCVQLCDPARAATACTGLIQDDCVEVGTGVGFCLDVSTATDIGESCTASSDCEDGVCASNFASSCIADCTSLLFLCPEASACITIDASGAAACLATCTPGTGGDDACEAKNPRTNCEGLGDGTGVCVPRCTTDVECGTDRTCNLTTGHCEG